MATQTQTIGEKYAALRMSSPINQRAPAPEQVGPAPEPGWKFFVAVAAAQFGYWIAAGVMRLQLGPMHFWIPAILIWLCTTAYAAWIWRTTWVGLYLTIEAMLKGETFNSDIACGWPWESRWCLVAAPLSVGIGFLALIFPFVILLGFWLPILGGAFSDRILMAFDGMTFRPAAPESES
jgi:hypothetical protein